MFKDDQLRQTIIPLLNDEFTLENGYKIKGITYSNLFTKLRELGFNKLTDGRLELLLYNRGFVIYKAKRADRKCKQDVRAVYDLKGMLNGNKNSVCVR